MAQNPFLIEEEPTAPVTPVVTQPETVTTNPFLVQEEQPVAQANPFLIPEEPVVPEALTTDFGDVTSERTYPIAEAEVEADVGVNPFAALEVVDRPRAAVASGLIATLEGKDAETIKAEAAKGISGEQHPMMGEYFSKKAKEVVDNPTEYPTLNTVFKGVDSLFSEAVKKYQVGMMPINIAKSGVYADLIKIGMADTEQEKQEAREDLNASLKSAFEPLVEAYTSNTAGLDALAYTAGFGVDVAIDPVTYTNPILSFTKKGKILIPDAVLDQYAKAANTTKQKAKDVLTKTKTGQSLTDAANYAWNLFSTKNQFKNKPKVEELRENFLNLIASGRVQAIREGREFQDRIKVFARETNTTEKEVEMFITEAVERGGVNNVNLAELSDEAIELLSKDDNIRYEVWSLSQRNANQLAKEIDAGVTITPLSEQPLLRVGDEDDALLLAYFNRAVTPDARKAINEKREAKGYKPIAEGGEGPTNMSGKHSSTIARNEEWEGLTINDINDMAKRGELPGYEGKVFKDGFFYSDPAIAQALRDSKHYRAIASRDLADQIIDPANNISIAPEKLIQAAQKSGWQPKTKNPTVVGALRYLKKNRKGWDRWEISNNPMTEGYVMDREIVEFVDGNLNKIYDPQEINKFLNTTDQVTNWWKAWTLSIFPSYHFRNEVGNVWNNFVMDVDPKFYQEAAKIQEAVMGSQITPPRWGKTGRTPTVSEGPLPAYTKFKTKDGTEYTYTQLRDMMDEQGIIGKGFMATDIESTLRSEMGDAKWLTLSKENKAIEIGKRIGEGLENNARMANFLDGLNKGLSPDQAAARVRKTLFDYSDLTQFEQDVMKRIMPFYTWTRKNVPFQIEQMIKKPGRYKAVDTLRQELESAISEEDTNERYLASWMIENYPTKVKIDEETGDPRYFILGGWLPAADAWKLAAAPARVFKDNLHPGIKLIYERISADEDGYVTDLFTGQKLHPKLKQNFVGVEMPETVAHDLKNLRLLATMDDFIQSVRNSESDQKIIKVLQGDHILGKAEKKLSPFASKPKTVEESLIAFLTGFRTYAVNLDQQKMFAGMDEEQKIKQLQKLYEQSAKRGSAQPELIEQAIDVTKEAQKKFKLGGMLDQARQLFKNGGVVRQKFEYGDVVDQAQYQYMLTGDDRYLSDTPPVEEKTELPFEKREDRGLILPMYSEEDGLIAPEIIATPANAVVSLGDAASGGDYTDKEVLESAVEAVPAGKAAGVAGNVAADKAIKAIAINAPNELPGFYGTPAERAAAVAKGGAQALLNIPQTVLSPSAMKDAREMGFGFNTRRILEKQAKRINSAGKERAELAKKIEANEGGDVSKLQARYDELGDDMKEASKVIVGQMTYNSNIAKQYGKESPIFKLWEGSIAEGTGMFNRDNFDLVLDSSIVPSRSFTKKDMDDFYGSISRAWKFDKTDKPINMVVRPVKFNSGGDFGEDFRKRSPYGKIIKQAVLETDNVPDFKKRLKELADEEGISTGLVDDAKRTANTKTTAMLNFGFKSSSYAEGGVNMVIKVNPKTKDYFFVVSDDHDLFGIVPRDADKLIAVTPVTRGNFKYGTAMSSTESEGKARVLKDREKRQTKKQRERDVAAYRQQMDALETMKDTKAELIDPEFAKEARLSGIHTDIVNELLRKTHKATPKQLAERGGILAALGLGVASSTAQADEEQNATPFAKGGVADEERDPESVSTEGVDMSGGAAAQEALVEFIAENAPVTGEYLSGKQAVEDYKEGDYGSAVVGGIGALPLVGAITRKGTKAAKLLDDLFSNFTDEAVAAAKKDAQAFKSKEVLVEMPIKQFLDLAEDNFSMEKFKALHDVEKYDSVPYLYVEEAGDIAKVTGHDGRHRARQMMVKGKETMPVMIKSHRYRWDQQTDPSKFDYKEDFPTILQGERGSTAELVRQEYDFPLKRGESGIVGFADGGLAEGNLNEEIAPEYDTMDAAPVEQPVQQVQQVRQAQAPQKPVAQVPNEEEAYLDRLAQIESSNNVNAYAETSGALGLYQFVPKTWESMVDRYMPELKQQKGDYMEFRRNPEVSRYMARKLMEENKNILKKKGVNATRSNLYLAHFAGPSGAVAVARAKPNTPISEILSEGQIKRNPGVFNKVKTAGQLMQWAQMKMLGAKK